MKNRTERNKITSNKNGFCETCNKRFHYLGITRHRAMHREKKEDCVIEFTYGNRHKYEYSKLKEQARKK